MVGGVGFLHHLTSAAQAVKHIIANFSDDPGIEEDDVFFFNDSYTAALHPPDVYMISPIHFRGTLTGFVANFVHVTDIGAIDPGGFSPNAQDNYQEGFQTKGLKIVERGKPRKDVVETFLNMVRDPGMTALDLKSQLAANHVAKVRMQRIYADYGVETVQAVSDALIQQSEQLVRQRLRELPDGQWSAREYIDMADETATVMLTGTKRGDTLTYDFTGSSDRTGVGINCCYWATWGAMFAPIFPLLAWDVTWNEGVARPMRLIAPEGMVSTAGVPRRYRSRPSVPFRSSTTSPRCCSRRCSGRATATAIVRRPSGMAAMRMSRPTESTPRASSSSRRSPTRSPERPAHERSADGVDLGGEIPNVVSRWANAESQELNTPLRYLYRRVVPDSGGPGKHRGGVCHEYAFTPHGLGDGRWEWCCSARAPGLR